MSQMTIVMEEGMFMNRLTTIIELVVPILKFHHEQITTWLFYSH
jgi:hypothetical protein